MSTRESLLVEFDHEMAATRRMLARVPPGTLAWKPHERSRSIGALAAHITQVAAWSEPILDQLAFDLDDRPAPPADPASVDEMLARFAEAVTRARVRLDKSDAELNAVWSLRQAGQELFCLPRSAAFRMFVLAHVVHHRGQLSVYLRLNDVAVPPVYGPSADSATTRV